MILEQLSKTDGEIWPAAAMGSTLNWVFDHQCCLTHPIKGPRATDYKLKRQGLHVIRQHTTIRATDLRLRENR